MPALKLSGLYSPFGKDNIMGDCEAHGSAQEDVGGEMAAAGNAREADCTSHAVRHEGDPTMVAVAVGDDGGDGHGRHRMHRIEAPGMKRIVSAAEEAIRVRAVACVL